MTQINHYFQNLYKFKIQIQDSKYFLSFFPYSMYSTFLIIVTLFDLNIHVNKKVKGQHLEVFLDYIYIERERENINIL